MSKKNRKKNNGFPKKRGFVLPEETKRKIWGILLILAAIIISLSFFERAGVAGDLFIKTSRFLIGEGVYAIPLIFVIGGFIFLTTNMELKKAVSTPIMIAIVLLVISIPGLFEIFQKKGGIIGYGLSWPLLNYFGFWASFFILLAPIAIGLMIFWQFLKPERIYNEEEEDEDIIIEEEEERKEKPKPSIIRQIFAPKFKVKEISPVQEINDKQLATALKEPKISSSKRFSYQPPPLNLLEKEKEVPSSGDTKTNSSVIKKTLQNFGIDVTMSEINIGPTVTQYTFKPAEGIKLSKITSLSNDLSLALAAHPIRIEAPVPGRALVGVEIPNKVRAHVRLRDLIENDSFQKVASGLLLPLGRCVSGVPFYADLTKMPHMLVAGSTGTGKTIFLNTLILSLLYQPSTQFKSAGPEALRLILVDPKRVEFPVFSNLPHLLCPIIYNATQTINALKWLTKEMERRFDVLAEARARDIGGFNEIALKKGTEPLPFIVVVIDELADLMAAKGREIEAAIVRLAQMARAVGIHLIVATQRPSVEVITGLIKANITSRVTFQVASQVDSRTVLDSSGAEKLLGSGDMLFISAQVPKPKRVQGPYVAEKEVRGIIDWIVSNNKAGEPDYAEELVDELEGGGEEGERGSDFSYDAGDDPLYEDAKKIVLESKRASASLLQRRLRLGYARAARLIDMLEDKGVVGPGEGAKPREVYGIDDNLENNVPVPLEKDEWEKI